MAGPTRKPSPGPWRRRLGRPYQTQAPQGKGSGVVSTTIRPPLIFQYQQKKPPDYDFPNVAANTAAAVVVPPVIPLDYQCIPLRKWPDGVPTNPPPDVIPILVTSVYYPVLPQKKWQEVVEGQKPLDASIIPAFHYDYPAPPKKVWPGDTWVYQNVALLPTAAPIVPPLEHGWKIKAQLSDAPLYNLALLTPPAAAPQPQPLTDFPATLKRTLPTPQIVRATQASLQFFQYDYPTLPIKRWPGDDFIFPNIASISFTPPPQPPAATDAGRHHKRYKVRLGSRTVYFATKAEAVAARERHRDVQIIEAKAAGVDPRKIKVRRARITQVTVDGRHPPYLAPAQQIARSHDAVLQALKESRMREEEEIAIALLLS